MLTRQTTRDDTLPHQIKLFVKGSKIVVTCNCKADRIGTHSKAGKLYYPDFGIVKNMTEARALYNDPANHNGEFGEEDKLRG